MAVLAHVITVGLSTGLNQDIRAWFAQFNFLPPVPLMAARVDALIFPNATFTKLLDTMAASPLLNFVLIIHGHEDGSGLHLNMTAAQQVRHTTHQDIQRLMDLDAGGPDLTPKEEAIMGVGAAGRRRILELRRKLRAKKIDCVEFRACNLGRNPLSLDRFRRFFGARVAGAPDIHSFFGAGPALVGQEYLEGHQRLHKSGTWETYNFPEAYKSPELVCCFQLNALSKPEAGGHIAAADAATLAAWVKQFVMPDGQPPARGDMAMHGLWISDRRVAPEQPGGKPRLVPAAIEIAKELKEAPLAGWGGPSLRRFIPPLGESYAKHIVYAR